MILLSTLRSLLACVVYPFFLMLMSLWVLFCLVILRSKKMVDHGILFWGQKSLAMFGVQVQVHGQEKIPEGSCLFLFNHTSFFDVFALHATVLGLRFGAKIELFKIPIFGYAMDLVGVLPIARDNPSEVKKVYDRAVYRAQRGRQFALAPEGTRSDNDQLKSFKRGPFIFAIQAQMPLVPVLIRGAFEVMSNKTIIPNYDRWSRVIHVYFLDPIPTSGLKHEDRNALLTQTRETMLAALNRL